MEISHEIYTELHIGLITSILTSQFSQAEAIEPPRSQVDQTPP